MGCTLKISRYLKFKWTWCHVLSGNPVEAQEDEGRARGEGEGLQQGRPGEGQPHRPPAPAPLTPAQAEETLADEAVPEAAGHGHVGLPGLGEHPAEGGQEEEVEESSHQSAHHLGGAGGQVRPGRCPLTCSLPAPSEADRSSASAAAMRSNPQARSHRGVPRSTACRRAADRLAAPSPPPRSACVTRATNCRGQSPLSLHLSRLPRDTPNAGGNPLKGSGFSPPVQQVVNPTPREDKSPSSPHGTDKIRRSGPQWWARARVLEPAHLRAPVQLETPDIGSRPDDSCSRRRTGDCVWPYALLPELPWDPFGGHHRHPVPSGHAGVCTVGQRSPTLLRVWVCPMRMRALEEMMEKQKLMRMTDRSERMYLRETVCQCPTGPHLHGNWAPVDVPRLGHHLLPADLAVATVTTTAPTTLPAYCILNSSM